MLLALLDRVPDSSPATVAGWRVAALSERVYPVLVPAAGVASGQLLTGLTGTEWHTLDAFEDPLYALRQLPLSDGRLGWAYVTDEDPAVLTEDWDVDGFLQDELPAYVERCRRWRQRYEGRGETPPPAGVP